MTENEEKKTVNLQKKSHETLVQLLNNIGIVGAVLAAVADIVLVIIFVIGLSMEQSMTSTVIYAVINALIGVLISVLLRYQGQKYAEIENADLCTKFYNKTVKERKYVSLAKYNVLSGIKDFIFKGVSTAFSIFGIVYISIEGSKNPIQILLTIVTLILFMCFGFIAMNTSYCRYYNMQKPYMEMKIKEKEITENVTIQRRNGVQDL